MAVLVLSLGAMGCDRGEARVEARRVAQGQEDAETLGREMIDLIDQTAAYRSSHSGRIPRRLRDLGIDSLTPTTARWIERRDRAAWITAAFRHPAGHVVSSCSASDTALEQLSLEGAFRLDCTLTTGVRQEFAVGGEVVP